eukprot:CAMPEP_0178462624 /NCGR_PEP_ID=MMETSP0689_2-20121128/49918_1 /TAXON_ID=160604 /ORGANISM="Amphidinium massartii, Strain CS-259" /LENGTH=266 /DNA_ID=CAMNT_0020089491 /DNA_START=100 /DNA_END=900 /DNA_ORIENTATION=+
MTVRRVLALSADFVVMCFARSAGTGACRVGGLAANPSPQARSGLPEMQWGVDFLFSFRGPFIRVEAERLTSSRLAVCFERRDDAQIACAIGDAERKDSGEIFGPVSELGQGRLISMSAVGGGSKLSACLCRGDIRDEHEVLRQAAEDLSCLACRFAEVVEQQGKLQLEWADSFASPSGGEVKDMVLPPPVPATPTAPDDAEEAVPLQDATQQQQQQQEEMSPSPPPAPPLPEATNELGQGNEMEAEPQAEADVQSAEAPPLGGEPV